MSVINHKVDRDTDLKKIKDSSHPRKVVVGGAGTGKSYLFSELIKKKRLEGKNNFLAITFIGKLGDSLADDLCGLAETTTMHSFARRFLLEQYKGWNYYPKIYGLIAEDLKREGVKTFQIGDDNYVRKTKYYKAVGDDDVIYYAVQICKKDENNIPIFDLLLVDEYQDFNSIESEFVDLLAKKNEIVIVGDDDQALYGFKGSSPSFIREKYDPANKDWESRPLRFSSRCTDVMVKYFHLIAEHYKLNNSTEPDPKKRRISKEYICYMPEGERDSKIYDSKANPQIHLIKNCPPGMIAYKIRVELEKIIKEQKIKEVLVIGEGRSCKALLRMVAQQFKKDGFKNIDYKEENNNFLPIKQSIIDAYRFIIKDNKSLLGWRILGNPIEDSEKKKHLKNAKVLNLLMKGTPSIIEKIKKEDTIFLEDTIEEWDYTPNTEEIIQAPPEEKKRLIRLERNEITRKNVLINQLKHSNLYLPRPLCNLDITICNILNAKGLGADVVFLIGFDQGKFPSKKYPTKSEIYQMLVAITRGKKRIYLINTFEKATSCLIDCLKSEYLNTETINI